MILRFILHIEWHRGYNHSLPRISIKRAPYPGQIVYDKGWGYRKLVMCEPCSGVGYFDAPLTTTEELRRRYDYHGRVYDSRAWIEQNHAVDSIEPLSGPFPAPSEPVYAQSITDEDVDEAEGRGVYRASESLDVDEDRDYCRWDDEGGNGHFRG